MIEHRNGKISKKFSKWLEVRDNRKKVRKILFKIDRSRAHFFFDFFPISFLFLNWNSSSAWSHRMPFLSLRSSISHLFFTSHCILLHQSTSSNYNIGNEKTKPLATEKKTSIFNGQFTVLHLKACYRYGPITGMLIVITQSISEKMRSLLIHLCREWRLVNEDLFFLPTAESN